jgi:hypothetical protein
VALGLLVAALGGSAVRAQEHLPPLGAVLEGSIDGECPGGLPMGNDFSLATADYGGTIINVHVTGVTLPPDLAGATLDIWSGVLVADDGSFDSEYLAYGRAPTHLQGRFVGTRASGSFRISDGGNACEGAFQVELAVQERAETNFEASVELIGGCGGGTIEITRAADALSITGIAVEGFQADGQDFSGRSTFPEGTVPIDPITGSFQWAYFPGRAPGQEIAVSGTFVSRPLVGYPGYVRGIVTASPSSCGARAFISPAIGPPEPGGGGPYLPNDGSGPGPSDAALLQRLLAALFASALIAIGGAFALRSGRS